MRSVYAGLQPWVAPHGVTKARTKRKRRSILRRCKHVRPEDVVKALDSLAVSVTERALRRWEKAGLIPVAERQNLGRGGGIVLDYPEWTPAEVYASKSLMDWVGTSEKVAAIRERALKIASTPGVTAVLVDEERPATAEGLLGMFVHNDVAVATCPEEFLSILWLTAAEVAERKLTGI